jgi:hypothetical protein
MLGLKPRDARVSLRIQKSRCHSLKDLEGFKELLAATA